jgi:hypothetical protein
MSADFLSEVWAAQRANHAQQAAQARADFEIAASQGDVGSAAEASYRLVEVERSWQRYDDAARQHAASLIPPPPPPADAWQDKRVEQMTDNDVYSMLHSTSKYLDPRQGGTPIPADEYRGHMAERDRRLSVGHYEGGRLRR